MQPQEGGMRNDRQKGEKCGLQSAKCGIKQKKKEKSKKVKSSKFAAAKTAGDTFDLLPF